MLLQNPFAILAPTGVDSAVLSVLAGADNVFTPREVHFLAPSDASLSAIRNALVRLRDTGIVIEHSISRSLGYSLNTEHILAPVVREISRAREVLLNNITAAINAWHREVTCILFGSAARNDMHTDSDIDLLFLIPEADDSFEEQLSSLCEAIHSWCGNEVNPLVLDYDHVADSPVLHEIWRDGIALVGDKQLLNELSSD